MTGYDNDFAVWLCEQAQLLRERRFDAIDPENIAEELESLARHEIRELRKALAAVVAQRLMYGQETFFGYLQMEVDSILEDSPSLLSQLDHAEWIECVWDMARSEALDRAGRRGELNEPVPAWVHEEIAATKQRLRKAP